MTKHSPDLIYLFLPVHLYIALLAPPFPARFPVLYLSLLIFVAARAEPVTVPYERLEVE